MPAAKINHQGRLVSTSAEEKKNTMKKEYKERLRKRPLHPHMKKLFKEKTMNYKLYISDQNKSPPITIQELE